MSPLVVTNVVGLQMRHYEGFTRRRSMRGVVLGYNAHRDQTVVRWAGDSEIATTNGRYAETQTIEVHCLHRREEGS